MITQWQSGETMVGRLRVEGAKVDPAIAQLRLPMLLSNALSHPSSLPPAAIVFIRKLSDPRPRSLKLQHSHIRPPAAWQQALNTKLENLAANAARPALGAVPANAEAVVFLDRSELLAALANDWCDNRLATCWWWQSLFRRGAASHGVKEFWQNAPQYVPAALDKLSIGGKAARFVKTFSDVEARALLVSVARTFALDDLVAVFDNLSVAHNSFTFDPEEPNASPRALTKERKHKRSVVQARSSAPWRDWVQTEQAIDLGPEQQMLLGIAVMLQRAPAKVRTQSFALTVEQWSYDIATAPAISLIRERKKIEGVSRPQISGSFTDRSNSSSSMQIKSAVSSFEESLRSPAATSFADDSSLPPETSSAQLNISPQPPPPVIAERQIEASVPESDDINSNFATSQITTDTPSIESYDSPATELQAETDFGGLFYLINLGIYLGLYGDFTTPANPGINLNVWDFVALVGRELVGECVEEDPVWTLLRQLAGRTEDEDPGTPEVRTWIDGLMPYIRARLRSALGLTLTQDPGPLVCQQPARVTITPAHIDVFFALAELPIELRVAGLDRDPGWLPAAGRFIHFHFD